MKFRFFILLPLSAVNFGCATWFKGEPAAVDDRPLTLSIVNLFSQIEKPRDASYSWAGDWEFRRDRLVILDKEFRSLRPDIAVFQDMMSRKGSATDSDQSILQAASFTSYHWATTAVEDIHELGELRSFGAAVLKPVDIETLKNAQDKELTPMGSDGSLTVFKIKNLTQPLLVFNVLLPTSAGDKAMWYPFIQEKIEWFLKQHDLCRDRLVVLGTLPVELEFQKYKNFMESMHLKDTSLGFCQISERCETSSSQNDIFRNVAGDATSAQNIRILVPQDSHVSASTRILAVSEDIDLYKTKYKLSKLWPTKDFGWLAKVRFPVCSW